MAQGFVHRYHELQRIYGKMESSQTNATLEVFDEFELFDRLRFRSSRLFEIIYELAYHC